jgi:hypothetical protein
MARTVQAVIDRVGEILQDADHVRYPVPQLIQHVVDAITHARAVRPDLFVASYTTPLPDTLTLTQDLPLPDQFFVAVCYYVVGSAELRDDEFAVDGRAMTLQQALTKKLVSGM